MNKEQQMRAIAKIKGWSKEMDEGLQALNPTPIEQVKSAASSGRGMSLLVGVVLITIACYFNPQIPAQFKNLIEPVLTQLQAGEVEIPTNKGGR